MHRYFIYYRYSFTDTVGDIFENEVLTTHTMERDAQATIDIPNPIEYDSDLAEIDQYLRSQHASQIIGFVDLQILNWHPLLGIQRPAQS